MNIGGMCGKHWERALKIEKLDHLGLVVKIELAEVAPLVARHNFQTQFGLSRVTISLTNRSGSNGFVKCA